MGGALTQPVLRTERLILRPFRPEDGAALDPIFRNEDAMRYFADCHTDLAQSQGLVDGTIAGMPHETCDFILERDGAVIGKAGMWRMGEIGFLMDPAHWGEGLMTEALTAILPHLFATYDIPSLTADVDPDNARSLKLLESLGFRRTGYAENTIVIAGRNCHSIYMALDRPG